jgi:YfiH family protein
MRSRDAENYFPGVIPEWFCPANVNAFFTTRKLGVSTGPYAGLNLAQHVEDDPNKVEDNRASLPLPASPVWLNQIHSNICIEGQPSDLLEDADASFTREPGRVLSVLVADCIPILFCNSTGDCVAVAHAGWRGLANGVIEATLSKLGQGSWMAWLGPSIGPCHYVVGQPVREAFAADDGFERLSDQEYRMDLRCIAKIQLDKLGVASITDSDECTYCDAENYYSYRRDGVTGRMGGFIWFDDLA